jgi:hypothetical protein
MAPAQGRRKEEEKERKAVQAKTKLLRTGFEYDLDLWIS